jgi:hypothetical protein
VEDPGFHRTREYSRRKRRFLFIYRKILPARIRGVYTSTFFAKQGKKMNLSAPAVCRVKNRLIGAPDRRA